MFHCVQNCFRFNTEGIEAHVIEDIKENYWDGEVVIQYDYRDNNVHATT